jgi:hypothetical protein
MKTKNAIMGLTIALSLGVGHYTNAAGLGMGKAVLEKYRGFEKDKAASAKELTEAINKKTALDSLKSPFAKKLAANATTVSRANPKITEGNLRDFSLRVMKDSKGVDTVEVLARYSEEIKAKETVAATEVERNEIKSMQDTFESVSTLIDLIGGKSNLGNSEHTSNPEAVKAAEKLLEILPDLMLNFTAKGEAFKADNTRREAYTKLLKEVLNEMGPAGNKMALADALLKILGPEKLKKLIECTL